MSCASACTVSHVVGVAKVTERNRDDDGKQVKSNPVFFMVGWKNITNGIQKITFDSWPTVVKCKL